MTFKVKDGLQVGTTTVIDSAGKLATGLSTPRTIALAGDVTGSATFDGTANISITTTVAANSVALGADTTGNYVAGVTAGTGILITGTPGEGWSPTIELEDVSAAIADIPLVKVIVDAYGRVYDYASLVDTDIPSLDASKITTGTIDAARLPSYVDDVLEYANLAGFPASGVTGKIYVALDTNKTYRWSGSAYVYITSGAVDSVAGKTGIVTLAKGDVGLGSVDNTADSTKNVLSATKLTTARTIALAGAVTGSASFDGSGDISLTTTVVNNSHDHTWVLGDSTGSVPDTALQYLNLSGTTTDSPTTDWWNVIRMGHGNPNTYYNNTLAMKMTGTAVGSLWGRTRTNGIAGNWFRFYDDNYSPKADKLTTARTINGVSFDGTANITVADATKLPLAGGTMTGAISFAAGQTWPTFNQNTTGSAGSIASQGAVTALSGTTDAPTGITMQQVYSNGYPTPYGNVISLGGSGFGQILVGWSGTSGAHADNYIRSQRDTGDANWSGWAKIWTDANLTNLNQLTNGPGYTTNTGTVTSVGGAGTVSGLSLSGTVTTSGNLTLSGTLSVAPSNFASQTANTVLAAPNGADGVPTFRALVAADIPTLNQSTTGTAANVTGTVAVANGGTGATTSATALTNLGAQAALVSGTNIKTVNGNSLLGSGDLTISGGASAPVVETKTGAYTVVAGDAEKILHCTGAITLPTASSVGSGFRVTIFNKNNAASNIAVTPSSGTIEGRSEWQVYAGESITILSDGSVWWISSKKAISFAENNGGFWSYGQPRATGQAAMALGINALASGGAATAIGFFTQAVGNYSLAIGGSSNATRAYSALGSGAIAIGGSYANGADALAITGTDTSSNYGALGTSAISIGKLTKANGTSAISIGDSSISSASYAVTLGRANQATRTSAYALGQYAKSDGDGKLAYSSGKFASDGDAQFGLYIMRASTTNNTPTVLTTDNLGAVSGYNSIAIPANSTCAYSCIIVARVQGDSQALAAWKVEGILHRDTYSYNTSISPAITILNGSYASLKSNVSVTINGTNGLYITATGLAATNIRWVATVQTTELTYA